MQDIRFKAGDRVRHDKRPEWGTGLVQRVESMQVAGQPAQRLVIRFANGGLKTISSVGGAITPLEVAAGHLNGASGSGGVGIPESDTLLNRESEGETGWLAAISKQKPESAMVDLPIEATDPFLPRESRLKATLELFRFQPTGRSLVDWAVARSGLDDPLSRFTRHELEQFFERWSFLRNKHLAKLVEELKHEPAALEAAMRHAPPAARRAVLQLNARR